MKRLDGPVAVVVAMAAMAAMVRYHSKLPTPEAETFGWWCLRALGESCMTIRTAG